MEIGPPSHAASGAATLRILLTGATGFIGRTLADALEARGHAVLRLTRDRPPEHGHWRTLGFERATPEDWRATLAGIDVVINAVGIFREARGAGFEALHVQAPSRLFEACVSAGVRRVVQISALGADPQASTAYLRSKGRADALLSALAGRHGIEAVVARPSLVFGPDGTSAALFLGWASLPALPVPAQGRQCVQPLHLDDLVEALCRLAEGERPRNPSSPSGGTTIVDLVGPQPLPLRDYLQGLRAAMRLPPAPVVPVPRALVAAAAAFGSRWPAGLFDRDSWTMLQQGSCADAGAITGLLGAPPRPVERFLEATEAPAWRAAARLGWIGPLLRLALAIVWIGTAFVSAFVYPVALSRELLARSSIPDPLQTPMLYGASALDLLLGLATLAPLARPLRRRLWVAQALLILGYSLVISLRLPEFWAHPYGPMLKNLPILALLLVLWALDAPEVKRWNT